MASFVEDCWPQSDYREISTEPMTSSNVIFDLRKNDEMNEIFSTDLVSFRKSFATSRYVAQFSRYPGARGPPPPPSTVLGRLRPRPCEEKVNLYVDLRSGLG